MGEAALANAVNLYVVQLKPGTSWRPMPEGLALWLDAYPDGMAAGLAHLRYLVALGDLRQALNFLESEGQALARLTIIPGPPADPFHTHSMPCYDYSTSALDLRVGLCEPALSLGLRARGFARDHAWSEAVSAYREFLARAPGNLKDDILPEYHLALASLYANQQGPDACWRSAMHYWKAGRGAEARQILANMDLGPPRVQAYRRLLEAEAMLTSGRAADATSLLAAIQPEVRSAWLRAQLVMASAQGALGMTAAQRLREYVPTIPLDESVAGTGRLVGMELLEPDLIGDGGQVSMLLFWKDLARPQASRDDSWFMLTDDSAIQLVVTRNLVPNPGFEWSAIPGADSSSDVLATPVYWAGSTLPIWRLVREVRDGQVTTVSCLDNEWITDPDKFSGFSTWFFFTVPNATYLQMGWLRSQRDPSNVVLALNWDSRDVNGAFFGSVSKDWRPYAGLLHSPAEARSAHVIAHSNGPGAVWFDDIILVRLPDG